MQEYDIRYGSLPNKVRTLEIPIPNSATATCIVMVKTGARNEIPGKEEGLSHFVEHMVYRGTKNFPSYHLWARAADHMGPEQNAETGMEFTQFYIIVNPEFAPRAIGLLGELLAKPLIPSDSIAPEKNLIIKEIESDNDDFGQMAQEEFENLLYDGTAMANTIISDKDTILSYNRRDITKYKEKWYKGGNVLVVTAGKVGRLKPIIRDQFGSIPEGPIEPFAGTAGYGAPGERVNTMTSADQAYFVLGFPGVAMNDERYYALQIASIILGGDSSLFSSRLYEAVQFKSGSTYDLSTYTDASSETGYLAVSGSVAPKLLPNLLDTIRKEIFNLPVNITKEEVIRAKRFLKGDLRRQGEVTFNVAQQIAVPALIYDSISTPAMALKQIDSLKMDDVRKVISELLTPEQMRLVVVGPVNEKLKRVRKFNPR